jgi:hypothetical protein
MPFGVDIDGKCLERKPGPAFFTDEPLDPPPFFRELLLILSNFFVRVRRHCKKVYTR